MQNENFKTIREMTFFDNGKREVVAITIEFPNCYSQCLYKLIIKDCHKSLHPCFYFSKRVLVDEFMSRYKSHHSFRFWWNLQKSTNIYQKNYALKLLYDSALSKVKIDAPKLVSNKLKYEKFLELISDTIKNVQIKCDDNGNYYFDFVPNEK